MLLSGKVWFLCLYDYMVCTFRRIFSSHLLRQKLNGGADVIECIWEMDIWITYQRILVLRDIGDFDEAELMHKWNGSTIELYDEALLACHIMQWQNVLLPKS